MGFTFSVPCCKVSAQRYHRSFKLFNTKGFYRRGESVVDTHPSVYFSNNESCNTNSIMSRDTRNAWSIEWLEDLNLGTEDQMLAFLRKRGITNLKIVNCDMNSFDAERTFDRILSIEMLEHMKNYQKLLKNVSSWMKTDGLLFIHIFSHKTAAYHFEVTLNQFTSPCLGFRFPHGLLFMHIFTARQLVIIISR